MADTARKGKKGAFLHPLNWLFVGVLVEIQAALLWAGGAFASDRLPVTLGLIAGSLVAPLALAWIIHASFRSFQATNLLFPLAVLALQAMVLFRGQTEMPFEAAPGPQGTMARNEAAPPPIPGMEYGETGTRAGSPRAARRTPSLPAAPARAIDVGSALRGSPVNASLEELSAEYLYLQERLHEAGYFDPHSLTSMAELSARSTLVRDFRDVCEAYARRCREARIWLETEEDAARTTAEQQRLARLEEARRLDAKQADAILGILALMAEEWGQWDAGGPDDIRFERSDAGMRYQRLLDELAGISYRQIEVEDAIMGGIPPSAGPSAR